MRKCVYPKNGGKNVRKIFVLSNSKHLSDTFSTQNSWEFFAMNAANKISHLNFSAYLWLALQKVLNFATIQDFVRLEEKTNFSTDWSL